MPSGYLAPAGMTRPPTLPLPLDVGPRHDGLRKWETRPPRDSLSVLAIPSANPVGRAERCPSPRGYGARCRSTVPASPRSAETGGGPGRNSAIGLRGWLERWAVLGRQSPAGDLRPFRAPACPGQEAGDDQRDDERGHPGYHREQDERQKNEGAR